MAKLIQHLGYVKFPFKKILGVMNLKSTVCDEGSDVERINFYRNRDKKQLKFSKKVKALYGDKADFTYFYRYKNTPKIKELIPASFWRKYKISKDHCDIRLIRYKPGTASIPHIDRYAELMKKGQEYYKGFHEHKIKRLWITLTEPKMGHALFVEDEVAYNLKKGTVLTFPSDVVHAGCNVGHEDRFILTVTGYYG